MHEILVEAHVRGGAGNFIHAAGPEADVSVCGERISLIRKNTPWVPIAGSCPRCREVLVPDPEPQSRSLADDRVWLLLLAALVVALLVAYLIVVVGG